MPGIINPIEAKQRKGKGAVGAYGSERTTQSLQDFPVVDSEEEAEEVSGSRESRRVPFLTVVSLRGRSLVPSVPRRLWRSCVLGCTARSDLVSRCSGHRRGRLS